MAEEMRFHLDERADDHAADGLSTEAARLAARRKFGGEEQLKELCRDQRGFPWLEDAAKDLRHAARVLRRNAGFAIVAILTLALGIGATTVMFSLVHTTVLQPLPYREPTQLVRVWDTNAKRGLTDFSASAANFISYREETRLLSGLAAWRFGSATLVTAGVPEKVDLTRISGNLLSLLGLAPLAGRDFLPEEDSSGKDMVLIISDRFWEQRFQRSPAAFGQTLMLDGYAFTIVGVAPAQLAALAPGDMWKPLGIRPGAEPRSEHWLRVVGRLQPGVSLAAAQKEMDAIAGRLAVQYPESNENWGIRLETFRDWIVPASTRKALLVLFGAVGCVLLIGIANLANLLLVRALARARELAMRVALGASRSRIARQLVAENGLLVAVGAGTGWLLALWGAQLLRVFRPGDLPRLDELQLDTTALAFTLGVSGCVALFVSFLPAWQAGRIELQSAIKQEGAATAPARGLVQSGMAIGQLALCAALLVAAALFAQSFARLQSSALGFTPEGVRLFRVALDDSPRYGSAREQIAFQRALEEKIAALPGVTHVGITTAAPFAPATHRMTTRISGTASVLPAGELLSVERFNVGPGYFPALGAPLRAGRFFDGRDIAGAAPVALLNEAAARRLWPGENAVGKTVIWNSPYTVVGVVADVRNVALDRPAQPALYVAAYQLARPQVTFAVRGSTPDAVLYDGIRQELRALDPNLPLFDARPLEAALWDASARPRFNTGLLGGFALVAVLLAGIGLYGITAYAVVRRTREFGLRMALGAQRREVLWLVLKRGVLHTAFGVVAGLALAATFAQTLRGLLHEVDATDPVTFAVIALVLGGVALLACWLPALRATRVDPLVALRSE